MTVNCSDLGLHGKFYVRDLCTLRLFASSTNLTCRPALFVTGYGKSEFERQIEAGRGEPPHIQLDPGEVVKGIAATFDEVKNAIQATGAAIWKGKLCYNFKLRPYPPNLPLDKAYPCRHTKRDRPRSERRSAVHADPAGIRSHPS